jgi:hypothetical protein
MRRRRTGTSAGSIGRGGRFDRTDGSLLTRQPAPTREFLGRANAPGNAVSQRTRPDHPDVASCLSS